MSTGRESFLNSWSGSWNSHPREKHQLDKQRSKCKAFLFGGLGGGFWRSYFHKFYGKRIQDTVKTEEDTSRGY